MTKQKILDRLTEIPKQLLQLKKGSPTIFITYDWLRGLINGEFGQYFNGVSFFTFISPLEVINLVNAADLTLKEFKRDTKKLEKNKLINLELNKDGNIVVSLNHFNWEGTIPKPTNIVTNQETKGGGNIVVFTEKPC